MGGRRFRTRRRFKGETYRNKMQLLFPRQRNTSPRVLREGSGTARGCGDTSACTRNGAIIYREDPQHTRKVK